MGRSSEGIARDPVMTAARAFFISLAVSAHSVGLHSPRSSVAIIRVGQVTHAVAQARSARLRTTGMDGPRDGTTVGLGHGGDERIDGLGIGAPRQIRKHAVEQPLTYRPAHPDGPVHREQDSHLPPHRRIRCLDRSADRDQAAHQLRSGGSQMQSHMATPGAAQPVDGTWGQLLLNLRKTATAPCTQQSVNLRTTRSRSALAPKDHPSTKTKVRFPRSLSSTGSQLRESVNMLCHKIATSGGPGATRAASSPSSAAMRMISNVPTVHSFN